MSSGPLDVHEDVKPGLDQAAKLQPGHGWVAADLQAQTDVPLQAKVEAGYKFNQGLAGYADMWAQPTLGKLGTDVGLRFNDAVDLYAGGFVDRDGNAGGEVGLKWSF